MYNTLINRLGKPTKTKELPQTTSVTESGWKVKSEKSCYIWGGDAF